MAKRKIRSMAKSKKRRRVYGNSSGDANTRTSTRALTRGNRTSTGTKTITADIRIGAVTKAKRALKNHYGSQLADLLFKRDQAKKKRQKKKLSKRITIARQNLRRYAS